MSQRARLTEPKLISSSLKSRTTSKAELQRNGSRPHTPVKTNRSASVSGPSAASTGKPGPISGGPTPTAAQYQNPNKDGKNTTMDDAAEGSEAFKNRVTEITQFRVYARVRPFIAEELAEMQGQELRSIVEMTDNKTVILDPKEEWTPKAQFEFDGSLWSIPPTHNLVHTFQDTRRNTYDTQLNVYNTIAKDFVPRVFEGFNSCILTYGQTGSGKTYTMMGIYDPYATCGGDGEEGIIPRVSNDLFLILAEKEKEEQCKPENERIRYRVEVNFVEIYMERVRDLLDPALKNTKGSEKLQDARIRQDPYSGPFVEGVTKYQVENWSHCCTLLERGSMHRTTCATAVHNQSSRSHAIFQLTVIQETTIPAKDRFSHPTIRTQAGRINLVDLAGSERGGFQDYVKESAAINTSLLALRRVIDNLTERQNILMEQAKAIITGSYYTERPLPQVPFRDSVLTWLLSDSIGGNARTTMVATLSPLAKNYGDTLATLQWSSKARNLVTLVKVNDAQTTITGGMSTKAGELTNSVRIQRQNVDTLQQTLKQKQALAEKLEKESDAMKRATKRNRDHVAGVRRELAAIVVQRAFRRHRFLKKRDLLKKQLATMKGELTSKEVELKKANAEKLASEEAEKAKLSQLSQAEHDGKKLLDDIDRNRQSVSEVEHRHKDLSQQCKMLRDEMGGDEEVIKREIDALQQRIETARTQTTTMRNDTTRMNSEVIMMEQKVKESKTEGWRKTREEDEKDVEVLRKKREELLKRKEEVQQQLALAKARHEKVFSKKGKS